MSAESLKQLDVDNEVCEKVIAERTQQYGDAIINAKCASRILTSLVETHYQITLPHSIPAHISFLFMSIIKSLRAANNTPILHDDYIDGINYLDLACRVRQKITKKEKVNMK